MKFLAIFFAAMLLVGCTETGNQRKDQVGETVVGQSFARAKDSVCMNNLSQIRTAINLVRTASAEETELPAGLDGYRGLSKEMLICPIDKKPYEYDAVAGTVKCKHLGHEKY